MRFAFGESSQSLVLLLFSRSSSSFVV